MQEAGDWFVVTEPRPDAVLTILAFPNSGGGCAAFARHARLMPDWLATATLNLPGRQARFGEPLLTDVDELTSELAQWCSRQGGPFLFFGYCSGALLAYNVARVLHARDATLPSRLIVGSFQPPDRVRMPPLAGLSSDDLWRVLTEHQAVPATLAQHAELRKLSEPAIRADFALVSGYRHVAAPRLPVPITVLAGQHDRWLRDEDLASWADFTSAGLSVSRLPTGHWFMEEDPAASVAALISQAQAECLEC
ncbi:MAG TPA: alpha/beta fold hydrolase [Streptosporangiaceae bacterium]|nr:alpha/beta fold hydrolase [Streptosporangiaceae bacterium]